MDSLNYYSNIRQWTRSSGAESSKPLSKLDSAKLKLSKFKLKYGKHEKQTDVASPLSSTDISSGETSPRDTNIPSDRPSEKLNREISAGDDSHDSEEIEKDSLISVSDSARTPIKPVHKQSLEVGLIRENPVQTPNQDFREDSSVSEILENVHSFSSIAIRSASELDNFSLNPIEDSSVKLKSGNKDEDFSLSSVEDSLVELDSGKQDEVVSLGSVEHGLVEPISGNHEDSPSSVEGSVVQLESGKEVEDFLLKPVEDSFKRNVSVIPAVRPQWEAPETSESSLGDTGSLQSIGKQKEVRILQNVVPVTQEIPKSTSAIAKGTPGRTTSEESIKVSSPTVISPKKELRQRHVRVQTDMKRSRALQVSLSSESSYEKRSDVRTRTCRSCPILRAASLPHGLSAINDELFDFGGMEDAEQLLLRSQLQLTLNLLRREQNLYFNCSRAAVRLERNYERHALSDTRQLIFRERKLRNRLRRTAKLETEGSQPYREKNDNNE